MTLNIVIVNYNVKYFLEQCLESVYRSDLRLEGGDGFASSTDNATMDIKVYVVDNASVDGSVEMVRQKFPQVHLIANRENVGFAAANNQALREIQNSELNVESSLPHLDNSQSPIDSTRSSTSVLDSQFVLLLNPDTVVERNTLAKCVAFFLSHPDCGGLGVKMINGEGRFLKESKRGFPTPAAAFYKISGLIKLFPHSRRIAAYYMGHLDTDSTNPVDILPGAFMMVRMTALLKAGLLDESYFMYGEDIDFSWRIKLAGYQNYYYPEARIIHYKGESTKRGSMNYVYTFYNAMSIFVSHYFTGSHAWFYNTLLHCAIWMRAGLAWLRRMMQAVALPLADFALSYAGFLTIKYIWATYRANNVNYYPPEYTWAVIPFYILLLMLASWFYGGYEKPVRRWRIVKGMAVGCALLLVFYSLLDESQRYSRMLLMMGSVWTLLSTLGIRSLLGLLRLPGFDTRRNRRRTCIIVGSETETTRVKNLNELFGSTHTEFFTDSQPDSRKLNDAIHYHKADEVIFCSKDISTREIIDLMSTLRSIPGHRTQVEYKIVPSDSDYIIGSNSIHSAEDLYTEELQTVSAPLNSRNKRMLDILSSFLLLVLSPLLFWPQRHKRNYFPHCWQVLTGHKSWVGTDSHAVFGPEDALPRRTSELSPELLQRLQLRYLRNYHLTTDLQILFRNLFNI